MGYWPLDGDGLDESGNLLDGFVNGDVFPAEDRLSNPSGAMSFAGGSGDNIDILDDPLLQLTGAMTITAWVYLDSTSPVAGSIDSRILAKMGGGGSRSWSSGIETNQGIPGQVAIQVSSDVSDIVALNDSSALPEDQWVHYAGVYTPGTSMDVYLDGELAFSRTTGVPASQYSANGHSVLIGNRPACENCGWYGALDEVRLYNEALSEADIEAIMGM